MTRRVFALMLLAVAVVLSSTFAGCAKKDPALSLQRENDRLRGELDATRQSQDQLTQQNRDLSTKLSSAERELNQKDSELLSLKGQMAKAPEPDEGARRVMEIPGSVLFNSGRATLTSSGKRELDSVASTIKSRYSGRHISVEGHTDDSPLVKTKATWGNNVWLSANRARSVADYLISRGVSEELVSVVGHGASRPKGGSKAQDRRVEIVVLAN